MATAYIKPALRNMLYSLLVIAAVWTLPWFLWREVRREVPVRRTPAPFKVTCTIGTVRMEPSVWSPVLFSLPSRVGFSAAAREADPRLAIMARPRPLAPEFLGPRVARPAEPAADWAESATAGADLRPNRANAAAFGGAGARSTLRVEWLDGLRQCGFDSEELRRSLGASRPGAWGETVLWVSTDDQGRPRSVFVESSSGSAAADRELIRALWRMKGTGAAPCAGRVRVTGYAPAP